MPFIHNSRLKAWINDLLGNNAADGQSMQIADYVVHPVVIAQPYLEIYREATRTSTGATTLFTTPSDKSFFLTNLNLNIGTAAAGGGTDSNITFTLADGTVSTFSLSTPDSGAEAIVMDKAAVFPMQGLKLAKASTIVINTSIGSAGDHTASIAGYIGDDRN